MTTILWAFCMVESRWATTNTVRPLIARSKACFTCNTTVYIYSVHLHPNATNHSLTLAIECAGSLIQYENGRILKQSSSYRDSLPLPTRQLSPSEQTLYFYPQLSPSNLPGFCWRSWQENMNLSPTTVSYPEGKLRMNASAFAIFAASSTLEKTVFWFLVSRTASYSDE